MSSLPVNLRCLKSMGSLHWIRAPNYKAWSVHPKGTAGFLPPFSVRKQGFGNVIKRGKRMHQLSRLEWINYLDLYKAFQPLFCLSPNVFWNILTNRIWQVGFFNIPDASDYWRTTFTYERPPKPPTIRNSYTRTLILDMIMKLSGTIGVTQKTMTFDMFAWFWIWRHSSSKLISAWNQASKSIQKLCAKSKRYHAEHEHTSKIRKWKAAQNDDQNDDWTMTIFLVSQSLQTHPHRERALKRLPCW